MDKDMAKAKEAHGFHYEDNSVLYLILQIIGLGIVNYCLIQNDLNSIADKNETV